MGFLNKMKEKIQNIFKNQDRLPQSIKDNIGILQEQFYQRKINEQNIDGQYK